MTFPEACLTSKEFVDTAREIAMIEALLIAKTDTPEGVGKSMPMDPVLLEDVIAESWEEIPQEVIEAASWSGAAWKAMKHENDPAPKAMKKIQLKDWQKVVETRLGRVRSYGRTSAQVASVLTRGLGSQLLP